VTCPFCHRLRGHSVGCRIDGAKSYELVDLIHEMAGLLERWFQAEESGNTTAMLDVAVATRKLLYPRPEDEMKGSLADACKALDSAIEESGGDITVEGALSVMKGTMQHGPARERKDVNCGDGSTEDDDR